MAEKDRLEELGITPGEWKQSEEKTVLPKSLSSQGHSLANLKQILEGMVEADQRKVVELKKQLALLKHGGGT